MTPPARVQAAIGILDSIIAAARGNGAPADRILAEWARANRYAGSGDRRAIRDLVYDGIRCCGEVPVSGRAAMLALAKARPELRDLFDGSRHAPAPIESGEPVANIDTAPRWLREELQASGLDREEQDALTGRAPLDLRVNVLKASRDTLVLPVPAEPTAAPDGLRLSGGQRVEEWPQWQAGEIEVQDTGSQLACVAARAEPGMMVVDLCAGAGGKTLALGAAMANEGRIIACDTSRMRLGRLPSRADRAGVTIAESRLLNPLQERDHFHDILGGNPAEADSADPPVAAGDGAVAGRPVSDGALMGRLGTADLVLVDAPCSGTGTWRRNPEARWRVTPAILKEHAALQARLLDLAAELVRPGGQVSYVVCSLLDIEGADQAAAFLERHPQFASAVPQLPLGRARGTGIRLTPAHDQTDGFFIANFRRT
ncbi:RsmB/NOP family class I SAM-dependent RNA methyltransferase [Croceicoccus sp. F390]|uniref:RsmB/NOP family class I SAM-dependent RNA methyltransferase n=1 Tax=Croceicoccus esteveae TaxID=3075597 RepID=A0ABU2ZF90_9SPHN|nr:RsmB/NOP family class I SAM-dependent RNA methyltransferase [Croceicoccus sp. F390]MDT0574881.1 RsmB/NOP family class I SAM-dependent RNA methyltransferase [Croceicoccus sp. F390]